MRLSVTMHAGTRPGVHTYASNLRHRWCTSVDMAAARLLVNTGTLLSRTCTQRCFDMCIVLLQQLQQQQGPPTSCPPAPWTPQ